MPSSHEEILNDWKRIPEQEINHLKDNVFEGQFIYVRKLDKDKDQAHKLGFLIDSSEASYDGLKTKIEEMWDSTRSSEPIHFKIKSHKNSSGKSAENDYESDTSDRPRLGLVIGISPREIKGGFSSQGRAGKLSLEKRGDSLLDYSFCWNSKGIFYFAILEKINGEEIQRFLYQDLLNTEIAVKSGFNENSSIKGSITCIKPCCEIITHDPNNKSTPDYPGKLYEDIELKKIPYDRQTGAVKKFGRGKMQEPEFKKVLLNSKEYRPQAALPAFPVLVDAGCEVEALDEYQEAAVQGALTQRPLFLIHGPPGTGKTRVIAEIIRRTLAADKRKRILVCSQTNLAVDEVLDRIEKLGEKENPDICPVRLASDESKIEDSVKHLWLNNLLKKWGKDKARRSNQHLADLQQISSEKLLAVEDVMKEYHQFLREAGRRNRKNKNWESFEKAFLNWKKVNVVGATCVHLAASRYGHMGVFDLVIMDEASKATPAETLIPILRAKRAVLIGDHKQLPPFVNIDIKERVKQDENTRGGMTCSDEEYRQKYEKSLFENLINDFQESEKNQLHQKLNIQRRMPNRVGKLISDYFYEKKLQSGKKESDVPLLPFKQDTSIVFINTSKRENPCENGKLNLRQNECNAEVIEETLKTLNENLECKKDVAIIAGYRGQVKLLQEKILEPSKRFRNFTGDIQINTVDGFQGRENDIVIFDVVRSNKEGEMGFLNEPRRLNVSLSRAKELLIIVGDFDFLSNRARPSGGEPQWHNGKRVKPLLGRIADELKGECLVFDSLEEALK